MRVAYALLEDPAAAIMVTKTAIVEALGETKLVLPRLVNDALAANDRIKYLLTLLQVARHFADSPDGPPPTLASERAQVGIDDAVFDEMPASAVVAGPGMYRLGGLARLLQAADLQMRAMLAPIDLHDAPLPGPERAGFTDRAARLLPELREDGVDLITGARIDLLTHGQRGSGDSLHLLVMDLHKALNRLQRGIATEVIDGASAYDLGEGDRALVAAFMRGLNRTSPLRFDHPGLGTTATRSGERLVLQNDIGTTDAHVLVIHVEATGCTITYTDVHLQRLVFFQRLFERIDMAFDDTRSVRDRSMEDGLYHLAVGRCAAATRDRLLEVLEFVGSRLVFLIDWNRARKRLRALVGKRDGLALLRWAADADVGHMGFLRLGGEQMIYELLEFAVRGQARFGQGLADVLGAERAVKFLKFAMRTATEVLLRGGPESLALDELRAELLRNVRSSGQSLFELLCEHAALTVEIAGAARDALLRLAHGSSRDTVLEVAARAKLWESDADRLLNQARSIVVTPGESGFHRDLLERADDVADDLEEAAFVATLIDPGAVPAAVLEALLGLGNLVVRGAQELVKGLESLRVIAPGAPREDTRDFLESVHRIAGVEHATDQSRRRIAALLAESALRAGQVYAVSECTAKLESAADVLLHVALQLRDHALGDLAAQRGGRAG